MTRSTAVRCAVALAALALLASAPRSASAQTVWTLPGNVVLNPPTATDFLAGYSAEGTMLLVVFGQGNRPWNLHVRATSPTIGGAGKPVSDVMWRTQGSSTWTPLSTGYVQFANGRGFAFVYLYFRVRLQWSTDGAGSYNAPIEIGVS